MGDFDAWCSSNNIILNLSKTVCLNFKTSCIREVELGSIHTAPETKFLGVKTDEFLNWKHHVNDVCIKINSGFFAINTIKWTSKRDVLMTMYYALIYSNLSYLTILWGNSVDANRVFVGQKRIIRLIFDLKQTDSCRPFFKRYNILPFPCIYIYRLLPHVKNDKSSMKVNSFWHPYETRNANRLLLEGHRLSMYEKSPTYAGVKMFNRLSTEIVEVQNSCPKDPDS